jgi:hypothetical protein
MQTRVEAESPEEGGEKGRAELAIGEVEGPVTEELETEQAEASVERHANCDFSQVGRCV